MKAKVGFIGTGGTISSLGADSLDLIDYGITGARLDGEALVQRFPEAAEFADIVAVSYKAVPSNEIYFPEWKALVLLCEQLVHEHPALSGIVIGHGTASLEETAYFLNLTLKVDIPVVLVGAQRPPTALSSDSGMNLVNAVRTAASPDARGLGVLVVLNDEIHAAREVTKTATLRLQTFRSPDFGMLGHVDRDRVVFYRAPSRRRMPDTEFDVRELSTLPRVDISYAYAGSDGVAVRAFIGAGVVGIISAGFAPGVTSKAETEALQEAARVGVPVVRASRVGSGRVPKTRRLAQSGMISADNLNPQKARLLLALSLTVTRDPGEIQRFFDIY